MSSYILPRNIPTNFENNPNIGCRVTGVDGRTDGRTDRQTDRRLATAMGPVDQTTLMGYLYLMRTVLNGLLRMNM